MDPEERVERNLRGVPGIRADEWLMMRNGIVDSPIASQERSVTHSVNSQSADADDIFHSVTGIRLPHTQSRQRLLRIVENNTTLIELSADSKPDLSLMATESHHVENETYYLHEGLGAIEDPFSVPEIIRTNNKHRTGVASHSLWAADMRHRAYTSFPKNAPRLNCYYDDQERIAKEAEKEVPESKIPTDIRIKTASAQPVVPNFVSFSFPKPSRSTFDRRRRLCRSASTTFNAFKSAAVTLLDPSKPTKHYTVGSLRVEAPEEEEEMEDDLEDDKNVKIKGGIVPGIAISPPEYATQGVQLVDDGAVLPVICQSFRVKTSLALPSKDGTCLNFVVAKHATFSGAKPTNKNQGAVMCSMVEIPIQTILSGLLNACRSGALNLETLKFVNNQKRKDRCNLTLDARSYEQEQADLALLDESDEEDDEPSL